MGVLAMQGANLYNPTDHLAQVEIAIVVLLLALVSTAGRRFDSIRFDSIRGRGRGRGRGRLKLRYAFPVLYEPLRFGIDPINDRAKAAPTGRSYASPGHWPGILLKTDSKAPKVRP
jgi:hypothetical protein